jgi:hypothetical protein
LSAGTFGELQAQLQKADQLQAIRSLQNKKIQKETEELKQELADMKAMVQRLQSTQTGSGISMPVNIYNNYPATTTTAYKTQISTVT